MTKGNPYNWIDDYQQYLEHECNKSKSSSAAKQLVEKMSDISEAIWFAGWMTGLEYTLWDIVSGNREDWNAIAVDNIAAQVGEEAIALLRSLSKDCDGWWIFDDGERFVTMSQWEQILQDGGHLTLEDYL